MIHLLAFQLLAKKKLLVVEDRKLGDARNNEN